MNVNLQNNTCWQFILQRKAELSARKQPQGQPAKLLTNEIDLSQRQQWPNLSGEAVVLSEFMQTYGSDFPRLNINLPGSSIHQTNQTINLLQIIRAGRDADGTHFTQKPWHPSLANAFARPIELSELASAFDYIMQNTNQGNNHLNNAFASIADMILSRETQNQANLFADVFLRNYGEHGMAAFEMAMDAIGRAN